MCVWVCVRVCICCVQVVPGQPRASLPTPRSPTKLPGTWLKAFPGCQSYYCFPQRLPRGRALEQLGRSKVWVLPWVPPTARVGTRWQKPGSYPCCLIRGVSQEIFRKHLPKAGITVGTHSQLSVCLSVCRLPAVTHGRSRSTRPGSAVPLVHHIGRLMLREDSDLPKVVRSVNHISGTGLQSVSLGSVLSPL